MNKLLAMLCLIASVFQMQRADAAEIGYTTGQLSREKTFSTGKTAGQGMAIRLGKEKLALLKGKRITRLSAVFGTKQTVDGQARLFLAEALGGEPLFETTVSISKVATSWTQADLNEPYVITGEEESLYIGCSVVLSRTDALPLSADYSLDTRNCSYVYDGEQWKDVYGLGCGNVNVRMEVEDCPSFTDIMVKTMSFDGYFKAGSTYAYEGQLFNFGTETVHSFDLTLKVGNGNPETMRIEGLDIASGQVYDFKIPDYAALADGKMELLVNVGNVNGGADADANDNTASTTMFFYPENMERNILLEGFTGQDCGNCPEGHRHIHNFIDSASGDKIVEVMHHSGYYPDIFSMKEDYDYTYLYGSSSTYAPAMMMNRAIYPQIGYVPVMNVSVTNLETSYSKAVQAQPYVSLSLSSAYNPDTREVTMTLHSYNHNDLPDGSNILNVWLVQDNLTANQSAGGSEYTHNAVCRGSLTGNSWGLLLQNNEAGQENVWSKTFTLPETIYSSYWTQTVLGDNDNSAYNIVVVPDDMYVVAYVGGLSQNSVAGHNIYNCVQVGLNGSNVQAAFPTDIEKVIDNGADSVSIRLDDHRIVVCGDYDKVDIRDMSGKAVPVAWNVPNGMYIVRVVSKGRVSVKKIMVK